MKAINLSNALTMSLLYCLLFPATFAIAVPFQEYRGGAIILVEPFAGEPFEIQTQMVAENGAAAQTYTFRIHDNNGQLQYEITTQSLQINLPSSVQVSGSEVTIFTVGYSAVYRF